MFGRNDNSTGRVVVREKSLECSAELTESEPISGRMDSMSNRKDNSIAMQSSCLQGVARMFGGVNEERADLRKDGFDVRSFSDGVLLRQESLEFCTESTESRFPGRSLRCSVLLRQD